VLENPYVHSLAPENLLAMLSPTGGASVAVVNYAPVQLWLHAVAWYAFGPDPLGHHVLNVALHALASLLLAALWLRAGLSLPAALLGGAAFLLHPANVEAVAWISQLKSSSALVLATGSLLAFERRPALGTALFGAALLAKPTAAFALPVAALLARARHRPLPWLWLGVGAALFAAFAVAEFSLHQRSGAAEARLAEIPFVLARSSLALALRYLVMAATSLGVSAFHEPEPVRSLLDPWWLLSLPVLVLLGWRAVGALRRREPESAFWVWALVSFAPVSQIFPFLYPMADRYLYFILPGLIGAALFAGGELLARPASPAARARARRAALALGVLALGCFALRSAERARLWRQPVWLLADAAAHYPHGVPASLLRAQRSAQAGDAQAAVAALRAAMARGYNRFQQLLADPALAPVRDHPSFQALVREMAAGWIATYARKGELTQLELRTVAGAHFARGEYRDAARLLERALEVGGPTDAEVQAELTLLRPFVEREN
jgi:hypothetical protein